MLANRSLPELPSSRPTPERLIPPKGTRSRRFGKGCRRFPLRAFPARQRTVTPGRASRRRPGVRRLLARALTLSGLAGRDAFAEERDVVVVDDERPSQHGLKGAGEAPLGTPYQVVVEAAALGPLRESGDVIQVVLVPHDPDSLAAAGEIDGDGDCHRGLLSLR